MKTPSFIKNAIYSWVAFFGTVILLSIGYATYSALSEVEAGNPLTKDLWNQMVGNIADIDSRVSAGNLWNSNGGNISYTGGSVGIGTSNPRTHLDVNGSAILWDSIGYAFFSPKPGTNPFGTDFDRFEIRVDAGNQVTWLGNTNGGTGSPRALALMAGTTERMRIDTNGNVGIGTPVPGQRLSVAGVIESTSGGYKFPDGSTQTTAWAPKAYVRFNGATCTTTCTINSSYNVSSVSYAGNVYTVHFTTPMGNANYVYNITLNARAPTPTGRLSSTVDSPVATTNSLSFSISGTANGGNFGWVYTTSDSVNIIIY